MTSRFRNPFATPTSNAKWNHNFNSNTIPEKLLLLISANLKLNLLCKAWQIVFEGHDKSDVSFLLFIQHYRVLLNLEDGYNIIYFLTAKSDIRKKILFYCSMANSDNWVSFFGLEIYEIFEYFSTCTRELKLIFSLFYCDYRVVWDGFIYRLVWKLNWVLLWRTPIENVTRSWLFVDFLVVGRNFLVWFWAQFKIKLIVIAPATCLANGTLFYWI